MKLRRWLSDARRTLQFARTPDSWAHLGRCDVLLVCNDSDRAYVFRGQRYAQLLDSLGDLLERNGVVCRTAARGLSRLTGASAYGAPASINRALLWIVLGERARRLIGNADEALRWREDREAALWNRILRVSGAKLVVAIQPDTGLCRAAHQLQMPVFDLQHGIVDTQHDDYYRGERVASRTAADLPSGYLTWDQESADALGATRGRGTDVRIIGNPWFVRFVRSDPEDHLVREARSAIRLGESQLPAVVVTLQHGMNVLAPDYVQNGVIANALAQAIRESCGHVQWRLRLHPSQMTGPDAARVERYLRAAFGTCRTVEWRDSSRAPLPLLLASADVHITHYSGATIEAAWLGIRTGLLDPHIGTGGKRAHLLVKERARGLAHSLPLDAAAILDFIRSAADAHRTSGAAAPPYTESLDSFAEDVKAIVAPADVRDREIRA